MATLWLYYMRLGSTSPPLFDGVAIGLLDAFDSLGILFISIGGRGSDWFYIIIEYN